MFKEVAIEPAYLSSWDRIRLIVGQCGFEHGRLISDFPKGKWHWKVFESCHECLPAEKKRIEEYLKSAKSKLIRRGRTFNEANDWMHNAKREHARHPFHAVITKAPLPDAPDFVEGAELHEGHVKWRVGGDEVVPRTTQAMGAVAQELLAQAKEIVLVDPNFEPKASYTKPLCRFVELATQGSQLTRLEYHIEHDSTKEHFAEKLNTVVRRFLKLPPSLALRFIRWKSLEQPSRDAMHPRYLLTDLGGLRYDYGLCEGNDGETTDVQFVPRGGAIYEQRWADCLPVSNRFEFVDGFEVSSQGVSELCIRDGRFQLIG